MVKNTEHPDPKTTSILPNFFRQITEPSCQEMEINDIKSMYANIDNKTSRQIYALLDAVYVFLCATAGGEFRELRESHKTPEEMLLVFETIGNCFIQIETKSQSKSLSKSEVELLKDAITYTTKCVKSRLEQLKQSKDKLFSLYQKENNSLKTFLNR